MLEAMKCTSSITENCKLFVVSDGFKPFTVYLLLSFRTEFFEKAGEIVGVRLAASEDGGFRGFGHVEFATEEAAQKVTLFLFYLKSHHHH